MRKQDIKGSSIKAQVGHLFLSCEPNPACNWLLYGAGAQNEFFFFIVLNTNKGVYAKEMYGAHKVYNVYYLVLSTESRALQ